MQYAHAMEQRGVFYADECIEIADDVTGDPQRDRLRIDARKWYASKLNPKVLGDKVEHTGTVRTELVQLTPDEANL